MNTSITLSLGFRLILDNKPVTFRPPRQASGVNGGNPKRDYSFNMCIVYVFGLYCSFVVLSRFVICIVLKSYILYFKSGI